MSKWAHCEYSKFKSNPVHAYSFNAYSARKIIKLWIVILLDCEQWTVNTRYIHSSKPKPNLWHLRFESIQLSFSIDCFASTVIFASFVRYALGVLWIMCFVFLYSHLCISVLIDVLNVGPIHAHWTMKSYTQKCQFLRRNSERRANERRMTNFHCTSFNFIASHSWNQSRFFVYAILFFVSFFSSSLNVVYKCRRTIFVDSYIPLHSCSWSWARLGSVLCWIFFFVLYFCRHWLPFVCVQGNE